MAGNRIIVTGATTPLGRALLQELTPDRAVAVIGANEAAPPGFAHVRIGGDGHIAADSFMGDEAVINVAHSIDGDAEELEAINVLFPQKIARAAREAGIARMVHLSSFAIFGDARHIDASTPDAPVTPYGRSKADGETRILSAGTNGFGVEAVRMPFMFSAEKPGSLGQLVTMAEKLRRLPEVKGDPLRRSMITYHSAARFLIERSETGERGRCCAADSLAFDYALLAKILGEEAGLTIRRVSMPPVFTAAVERFLPALGRRLFQSSLLDATMNQMAGKVSEIEAELRDMIRTRYGS